MFRIKALGYRPSEGADEIDRQRRIWDAKPQVRSFYELQVFPRVVQQLPERGPIVEVGSGAGTFRPHNVSIVATDVIDSGWLDVRCTATQLSFRDESLGALVAINVLHHLPSIGSFLADTSRALRPGGRCICVEPWITPVSRLFYRWFHQEDCHPVGDPLHAKITSGHRPMHGNTYVPFQVFNRRAGFDLQRFGLRLAALEVFSGLGWCLSMGFREGALLPDGWLRPLLRLENRTNRLWSTWAGLTALIVLERLPGAANGCAR